MIIDIHTHHAAPDAEAVVCASPDAFEPLPGQLYSLGIHPWNCTAASAALLEKLDAMAADPSVVIIGEAGVDMTRPDAAPLYKQLLLLRRHIELSERLAKPLLIHDVKAHDIILGLRRDLVPRLPWIIHGFRAKPSVAEMFTRLNGPGADPQILFSFGPRFNPDTLRSVAADSILAETDDSGADIRTVIAALSEARGEDLLPVIEANTARLIGMK